MWLSKREGANKKAAAGSLTGPVTLSGGRIGAWLEGERRGVALFSPGGYHWAPQVGEEVLVLKAGEDGERPCAVGVALPEDETLSPGEVLIRAPGSAIRLSPGSLLLRTGDASVTLTAKGEVSVKGKFTVNGTVVGPLPLPDEENEGGEG